MCLLRYPGGKQRAASRIVRYFPPSTSTLYSAFFGGGSVELEWLRQNPHGRVVARDNFDLLVNFWQQVLTGEGPKLAARARGYLPMTKDLFAALQTELRVPERNTPEWLATWFYVVNRSSFSGATLSGGMGSADRFNQSACDRLRDFEPPKGLSIRKADVFDSIRRRTERFSDSGACLYLDPPYWLDNGKNKLYGDKGNGHEGFDHVRLFKILNKLDRQDARWVLSYNNAPQIHELYQGFKRIPTQWKYGMSNDKNGKELIILSKEVSS